MTRSTLFLAVLGSLALVVPATHAQPGPRVLLRQGAQALRPVPSIARNSVANLHAEGDELWIGPLLNVTRDGGATFFLADADSLTNGVGRAYAIDVEGRTVWAGLGFSASDADGNEVDLANGFVVSTDGGETFAYRFPPLDALGDTVEVYNSSRLPALPIIEPAQAAPFDIDFDPVTNTLYSANTFAGVRRSTDGGQTWRRVILPPDNLTELRPDAAYNFLVAPKVGNAGHFNYIAFSVLVDEAGTVWAGTFKGVNRSDDGGVGWTRSEWTGSPNGLTGSWVISIEEQPRAGRNPVWMATWNADGAGEQGRYGITVTRNGGATFEQKLVGERIYDFAFAGERTVYAAGERGLFISGDDGRSWRLVRDFFDPARPEDAIRPDASVFSVAVTADGALWAGTSDGLFKSTDGGATFRAFRASVPLRSDAPTAATPNVDTYAYPNPFSPDADRFTRIRFDAGGGTSARIRVFSFGMTLVRTIDDARTAPGEREAVWDGLDDGGLRVANGVYFYTVDAGGTSAKGKVIVLE